MFYLKREQKCRSSLVRTQNGFKYVDGFPDSDLGCNVTLWKINLSVPECVFVGECGGNDHRCCQVICALYIILLEKPLFSRSTWA